MNFKKYNDINLDLFNYKTNDSNFNKIMKDFTDNINLNYQNIENINVGELHDILKDTGFVHKNPYKIEESKLEIKLFFEFYKKSKIFTSNDITKSNTFFNITELVDINKTDYAFTTVFFPNYKNNIKYYDYLLPTLLVGYMLKNNYQNYDLYKNGIKGTKAKVICTVTCDTDTNVVNILEKFYDEVIIVKYIGWSDDENTIKISDVSKGNISNNHGYSKVFTKLHIFDKQLFPFKKVIFLDSDLFPLMYFDSLFSLDTPAGWIEHKRQQDFYYGVSSWIYDRGQHFKHGERIPQEFTNLTNNKAADINASLLIIKPDNKLFNDMITELKQPLDEWFDGKGLWMGNTFVDYYCLPEQNYLTQKFSGQWYSVDMGFCSWLIDMDDTFGFTFAGFVKKPWLVQSVYHKYSINSYSLFSQINNQHTTKSIGYQLLNNYICKMITENKSLKYDNLISLEITNQQFDPWEPEDVLITQSISKYKFNELSLDQKKIYCLCNELTRTNIIDLYTSNIIWNISKNTYNLYFTALFYNLFDILHKVLQDNNYTKLYPFGNTLVSIIQFGCFDPNDDDNDFILVVNKNTYKKLIISIVKQLLDYNLCVYICVLPNKHHIEIVKDLIVRGPYKMDLADFETNFDFNKIAFFNFSYPIPFIMQYIHDNNITVLDNMKIISGGNNFIKIPWIDIFILYEDDNDGLYLTVREFQCKKTIFEGSVKNISVVDKNINLPKIREFMNIYYGSYSRLENYIIKSSHLDNSSQRKILYKIDVADKFAYNLLGNYIRFINKYIKNIYLINKQKYFKSYYI